MYHCCSSDKCHARVHRDILQSQAQHMVAERILPNVARHTLYRTYVRAEYGTLGRGNRVEIPSCVKTFIRVMFPDPDGHYVGHIANDDTHDE